MSNRRLALALAAFAGLSGVAWIVLDGRPRIAVLVLFGYFAIRTTLVRFKPPA